MRYRYSWNNNLLTLPEHGELDKKSKLPYRITQYQIALGGMWKVNKWLGFTQTCISAANHQQIVCLRHVHVDKGRQTTISLVPIEWSNILAVPIVPVGLIPVGLWLPFLFRHTCITYNAPSTWKPNASFSINYCYTLNIDQWSAVAKTDNAHSPLPSLEIKQQHLAHNWYWKVSHFGYKHGEVLQVQTSWLSSFGICATRPLSG